jgi:cysteinyl-tRNA synthetase
MSKSLGNIVSINDFLSKREGDVMRMLVLNGTYRAPLIFNEETLGAAEKNVERLKSGLRPASSSAGGLAAEAAAALQAAAETARTNFVAAMDNDFNTAGALAALFELVKAVNTARDNSASAEQLEPAQAVLSELGGVLGLRLREKQGSGGADQFIDLLIQVRSEVRKQKLWPLSDLIRDRLKELGITLEDTRDGTTWRWG